MDFETSFDEYMGQSAGRLIALEVSDNEDDYNSSVDSGVARVLEESVPEELVQTAVRAAVPSPVVQQTAAALLPAVDVSGGTNSVAKPRDEKKRWSFMSNNSSSKKRWSTLSFVSDTNTKSSKRLSVVSSDTSSKRSSVQSSSKQPGTAKQLKRSSTGASLRSMFNKIALKDEDKENATKTLAHKRGQAGTQPGLHSIPVSQSQSPLGNVKGSPINSASSVSRTPLAPVNQNTIREKRFSKIHMSPSMDNMSMFSQQSNSSVGSRWKFWKRRQDHPQDARFLQGELPSNSNSGMRSKSSLSDLRKSIFQNSIMGQSESTHDLKSRVSHSSLKHKNSQSSLKQKTSHPSLKKLQSRRNSSIASNDSSPQISLPIPDQVSRDKIRTKLRHSSSLVSINSSMMMGGQVIIAETDEYDESTLCQILELCTVKEILPFKNSPNLRQLDHYIYIDRKDSSIYKIVPLDNDDRECKMTRQMRLQELQLTMLLNGTPGFVQIFDVKVIRREDDQTLFLVYHMKNHGSSLNQMMTVGNKRFTVAEIKEIVTQCIRILYVAETKFQFEHRLLTLDHILIDSSKNITLIDYKLSRATYGSQVLFTRLDHPLFFEYRKDYNSVLQWLRQSMSVDSWPLFQPKTNLLWMNYVVTRLQQNCTDSNSQSALLDKIKTSLESTKSRKLWKRNEGTIESCADIVSFL